MDATTEQKEKQRIEPSASDHQRKQEDHHEQHLLYLPRAMWSPRYDQSFYTLQIQGCKYCQRKEDLPTSTTMMTNKTTTESAIVVGGKTHFPAWYYHIVVYRAREKYSVWRRYSQFRWLYQELKNHPPSYHPPPHPPPDQSSAGEYKEEIDGDLLFPSSGCPWMPQTDHFAETRRDQLERFLDHVLSRRGYGHHPAVQQFLELTTTVPE